MIVTLLIFLLMLSVLVLIHELGHFVMAKKFGIKVEEFGFGFPPRLWGIKRGETLYSINLLPIGGFVKLYGEDEAGAGKVRIRNSFDKTQDKQESGIKDKNRAFFARPVSQRIAVVVAGVVMNAVLAVIIFYAYMGIANFRAELPMLGNYSFFLVNQKVVSDIIVTNVSKNSPAQKVGIKPYSKITRINGVAVTDTRSFVEIINKNKGKEVTIAWEDVRSGKKSSAVVVPRVSPPKNEGSLGVAFYPLSTVQLNYETPVQRTLSGFSHPLNLLFYNFSVMAKLVGISVEKKNLDPVSQGVAGPVGIYSLVGAIVEIPDLKEKVLQGLNLAGILSISLAFFNILPIPAMDGGRLFFIVLEGVIGKKINQKTEGYIHAVGMAILLTLILLITFKDLGRIFSGQFPVGP